MQRLYAASTKNISTEDFITLFKTSSMDVIEATLQTHDDTTLTHLVRDLEGRYKALEFPHEQYCTQLKAHPNFANLRSIPLLLTSYSENNIPHPEKEDFGIDNPLDWEFFQNIARQYRSALVPFKEEKKQLEKMKTLVDEIRSIKRVIDPLERLTQPRALK